MEKYIRFLFKFKWFIVIAVPLIVLALASNLKHLEIDGSYRIWFEKDSKILAHTAAGDLGLPESTAGIARPPGISAAARPGVAILRAGRFAQ